VADSAGSTGDVAGWLTGAPAEAPPEPPEPPEFVELDEACEYDGREAPDGREEVRERGTGCRSAAVDRAGVDGFVAGALTARALTAGAAGASVAAVAVVRLFSVSVTAPEPEGKFTSCVEPAWI
jgi:hypothetical protein